MDANPYAPVSEVPEVYQQYVAANAAVEPALYDGMTEWWCYPVAMFETSPYPRTIFGSIASNGDILACEFNHVTRKTMRYVVGTALVDDHNAPAIWHKPGRRSVILWQNHSAEQFGWIKTGSVSGDLRSLRAAPAQHITVAGGFSYTELEHIPSLSDANQDTFYLFCRVHLTGDIGWNCIRISVNQITGVVTKVSNQRLISAGANLCYLTISSSHTTSPHVIRCEFGYNPASASSEVHGIAYFEIGAITSPFMSSLAANMSGTNLPLVDTAVTLAVPNTQAGWSRRLFYVKPGPNGRAIAYAEGPANDPNNWRYKQLREVVASAAHSGLVTGANA